MNKIEFMQHVNGHLAKIYQGDDYGQAATLFDRLISKSVNSVLKPAKRLTQRNVYLITYGDGIRRPGEHPLVTLRKILNETSPFISDVHILPMFPYTSDDGFSVTDYEKINPELGDWNDIKGLAQDRRLMFDFVANHSSKSGKWFQRFLDDDPEFQKAFLQKGVIKDTSKVIRPRTTALFHEYKRADGDKVSIWTTFSEDQVDNNVRDPKTLVRLTKVLLDYVERGATSIRLDAVGFMWKESGTGCMHLPQTHEIVKLWRTILDYLAPNVQIITETNVPHVENISYFGEGDDEANQVYQFPLPPLTLYAFVTGQASVLMNWAKSIHPISKTGTFFNFLASHDGIGLRPTEGILSDDQRQTIVNQVLANGGQVSYKDNPDGSKSVYELNINYGDALRFTSDDDSRAAQKVLAAHHILLSLLGVPAIYYHSLFGSRNYVEAVRQTGLARRINRQKLDADTLLLEMQQSGYRHTIHAGLAKMIKVREQQDAFDPYGQQQVIDLDQRVFSLIRGSSAQGNRVLCLTNVSQDVVPVKLPFDGIDVLTGQLVTGQFKLAPYEYLWVKEG